VTRQPRPALPPKSSKEVNYMIKHINRRLARGFRAP
jgi:hypothetical protein